MDTCVERSVNGTKEAGEIDPDEHERAVVAWTMGEWSSQWAYCVPT